MTEDRPIHVRVAEALGWTDISIFGYGYPLSGPIGPHPRLPAHEAPRLGTTKVPHYDTDWSALGPEIEKRSITLRAPTEPPQVGGNWWEAEWTKDFDEADHVAAGGTTALLAVCALLIKLGEKGKL